MKGFLSVLKKSKQGALYVDIPVEIIRKMKLKPFMAGRITARKNEIVLSGFKKTVKIKVNLDKKTIDMAKRIMKIEGYGSLDETFSNVVYEFITKKRPRVVYLYPGDYLEGGHILIEDYEKKKRRAKKHQTKGF